MKDKLFQGLIDIQRDMLKILGEVTTLTGNPLSISQLSTDAWTPRCDVFVTDESLIMRFDLAGIDKKSLHLKISPEYLRISGERCYPNDGGNSYYYSLEIDSGVFERKVFFPDLPLEKENPDVNYEDGFLIVSFRLKTVQERVIEVEIE